MHDLMVILEVKGYDFNGTGKINGKLETSCRKCRESTIDTHPRQIYKTLHKSKILKIWLVVSVKY